MKKCVLLNKDNVVIDLVDTVKPVKKNEEHLVVLCEPEEAQGYIGSDNETVYACLGSQFQQTFYDIASLVWVEDVPAAVRPLMWKYDAENGFYMNEDPYPDTNAGLTTRAADLEDIVLEISEIIYA